MINNTCHGHTKNKSCTRTVRLFVSRNRRGQRIFHLFPATRKRCTVLHYKTPASMRKEQKTRSFSFFFCHTADDTNNVISETAKFSHTLRIIIYTCIHIYIYIYNVLATFLCLRFVWSTLQYETNKKKKCVQQGFICFKLCNKFQYKMQGKKASSEASLNSCTQDEA